MSTPPPILVMGAAGRVGGVGRTVVELLRGRSLPVRALVFREDARAESLRHTGAEVVVANLTHTEEVARAMEGCRRVYFGMSTSERLLEATAVVASAARAQGNLEVLVNISQMTVSQMSLTRQTDSHQQRLHWLSEQVLAWSGLPVVEVRPTVFFENPFFLGWAAESIKRDGTIRLPFGAGRTSPVSTQDVAEVVAHILQAPAAHVGKLYELTGPRSLDMHALAAEYASALRRKVTYVDVPFEQWRDEFLRRLDLPGHLTNHLETMARLHAANRYDRATQDVERLLGRPATDIARSLARHPALFSP